MLLLERLGTFLLLISVVTVTYLHWTAKDPERAAYFSESETFEEWKKDNPDTIGGKYGDYLIFVNGNADQWNQTFDLLLEDYSRYELEFSFSKTFERGIVNNSYSPYYREKRALNRVCEEAYKMKLDKLYWPPEYITSPNIYLYEDIWRYCTPFEKSPYRADEILDSSEDWNGAFIRNFTLQEQRRLISAVHDDNNRLWTRKLKMFFSGLPPTDPFFNYFYTLKNSIIGSFNALQQGCLEAYKYKEGQLGTSKQVPVKSEVLRYCTLFGE